MTDRTALSLASLFVAASLALIWKWRRRRTGLPYPPGPKKLPLLGNALDIPLDVPVWEIFTSTAQRFDTDVLHMKLLTTDMIILSSPEAVADLIEKRSNIYSDRPDVPLLDLMGRTSWGIPFMKYGSKWRSCRKLLHEFLNARAVEQFDQYQYKHAYRFLSLLAESPDALFDHIELGVAALTIDVTYGMNITNNENKFLRAAAEAFQTTVTAGTPGKFLVNTVPILKHVPDWFPGTGFKTFAKTAREKTGVLLEEPLEWVRESMKTGGSGNSSIAYSCLDRGSEVGSRGYDERIIEATTATMYIAAVTSSISLLEAFFLAMAVSPHVVKKAQEELDRVVGSERLPELSDEDDLPYISAIVKELFRWGCPTPLAAPKRVMEDDIYKGYFIPGGALVFENIWAIFYDESIFPEPHKYDPERYLKDGELDRSLKGHEARVFGSGRRVCPGKNLATRTLFLNIACILAVFNIEAPPGEKLEAKFHADGILRHPAPFKCTIKPRTEASLKLVRSACAAEDQ